MIATITSLLLYLFYIFSLFCLDSARVDPFSKNRRVMISFVVLFQSTAYKLKSNFLEVAVKHFLECFEILAVSYTKKITERMEFKASRKNLR